MTLAATTRAMELNGWKPIPEGDWFGDFFGGVQWTLQRSWGPHHVKVAGLRRIPVVFSLSGGGEANGVELAERLKVKHLFC